MLGESKSDRINYGTIVVQSSFWLTISKVLKISFISFLIMLFPYFYFVKFTFEGGFVNYYFTLFYVLWDKFFSFISYIPSPIFSQSITHNSSNLYNEILIKHQNYFVLTLTFYIFMSIVLSYFLILWVNKKGIALNEGQRIRENEVAITNEKGLIKLIKSRVDKKNNDVQFTNWDLNFTKNLRIPYKDWFTHFAVCGAARTGKSNFIKSMIKQARNAKMKGCIVDVDGDYLEVFYKPGDIILSLNDIRSSPWDFWNEPIPPPTFYSDALLSPNKDSTDFFDTAGGKLLSALIRISKSHEEFWQILCLNEESLLKLLDDFNEPIKKKYIGKANSDQGIGAVASSIKNLDFVKFLNHHAREKAKKDNKKINWFTFHEWIKKKDDSFVFILAKDNEWEESKPLIKVQIETFVSAMIERGEAENNIPVILVMDELHKIGKLQVIEQMLSRGSKHFLTSFVGYQNSAQIRSIYGDSEATSIFSGLQNLVSFKCTDPELASQISDRLGKIEIETSEGSIGGNNKTNNVSLRQKEKCNVSSNQIMSLEKNCAWVKLAYYPPCYLSFDYLNYEKSSNEDGSKVQKSISVRANKSWVEDIRPIKYYFGKKELEDLVTRFDNYLHYSDNEKVAILSEIFREIAFKVQHHEYKIDSEHIRYYFDASEEIIVIGKEENGKSIFNHIIKRSKKKVENDAKEKDQNLNNKIEDKNNNESSHAINQQNHVIPKTDVIEKYFE